MPFPILAAIAAVQAIGGAAKAVKGASDRNAAEREAEQLLKMRKPYEIPKEVYDVLNATQSQAQSGFNAETLDYLTSQTNQAFSGSIDIAKQLGADPNALSAIFGQKINSIMEIGAQNHQLQMQNFSQYLNALQSVSANKDAKWQSEQNLIKDRQQAAQAKRLAGQQEVAGGTNMIISAAGNYAMGSLYQNSQGDVGGYIPQTTNTTGYVPPPIISQSQLLRQQGLRIGG